MAALSIIGLIVSARMQTKIIRAARGQLTEPSVVQSPRARLGGTPNSAIGLIYYAIMLAAAWWIHVPVMRVGMLAAALAAAAFSVYLAYSLLFVTRMPCAMCWTGHAVNWLILGALVLAIIGR